MRREEVFERSIFGAARVNIFGATERAPQQNERLRRADEVFFVGSCARLTAQLRGKTGLASLNRFRPTPVGSQQGLCAPYPNAAGFTGLGRHVESMAEEKQDHVDEAACLYVADDLYDDLHSDNIILD